MTRCALIATMIVTFCSHVLGQVETGERILHAFSASAGDGWSNVDNVLSNTDSYANNNGTETYLTATMENMSLPAGAVIKKVLINASCRFDNNTTGRIQIQVMPYGITQTSPVFTTSNDEFQLRMGDQADITHFEPNGWTVTKVSALQLKIKRRSLANNDTRLRVRLLRIRVVYEVFQNPPYNFTNDLEGWTAGNCVNGPWHSSAGGWPGILYVDQVCNDAYVYSPPTSFIGNAREAAKVRIYNADGGAHNMQLFWTSAANPSWSQANSSGVVSYSSPQGWTDVFLPLTTSRWINQNITRLRLDFDNLSAGHRWHVDYVRISSSQCNSECYWEDVGDDFCDPECYNAACSWDGGDCGQECAPGCPQEFVGDLECQPQCFNAACGYDDWDCPECAPGCPQEWAGDGECQSECNNEWCEEDWGDCEECPQEWVGDGFCDPDCYTAAFDWDGGDCGPECAPGCPQEFVGDGECQPQCVNAACGYDDDDCGECAPGCYSDWIGDGWCDEECDVPECNYDGADCEVFLTAALSRKNHGLAGEFRIYLPLNTFSDTGIEPRAGGPTQVVLIFSSPADGVNVQASAGNVDEVQVAGSQALVQLSGVANATCLTLAVSGILGLQGDASVHIRVLAGDVTGDGAVNIFDLVQVRNQLNQPVTAANYRADVTADGAINIFDLVNVRNNLNRTVSCPQ